MGTSWIAALPFSTYTIALVVIVAMDEVDDLAAVVGENRGRKVGLEIKVKADLDTLVETVMILFWLEA